TLPCIHILHEDLVNQSFSPSPSLTKNVVTICRKQAQNADHLKPTPHVIHEGLELSDQLFNRRATAIVQQALTPSAVVYFFSRLLFKSRHEAYRVIRDQMEDIDGVKRISHNQMQICSLKFCLFMLHTAK
ncbi:hypothetical protein CU097_001952, partial [Rhizopus azygosporus]